jgi:hypothetical protein
MRCYCCGEEREPAMVASLQCHEDVKICRVCVGWLRQRAGGVDVTPTLPVRDIDEASRFTAAGLPVTPVQDMPWGMHEFTLTDPNGNNIRVGRTTATEVSE